MTNYVSSYTQNLHVTGEPVKADNSMQPNSHIHQAVDELCFGGCD